MKVATLLESLDAVPLVDHHAHGILRAQPTRCVSRQTICV